MSIIAVNFRLSHKIQLAYKNDSKKYYSRVQSSLKDTSHKIEPNVNILFDAAFYLLILLVK